MTSNCRKCKLLTSTLVQADDLAKRVPTTTIMKLSLLGCSAV
jgi:hypothetical protein